LEVTVNFRNNVIVVLLIAALLIIVGVAYGFILANNNRSEDKFLIIILDKKVLGNGSTIELTVTQLTDPEIDFNSSKLYVTTPSNQVGGLDLKNITWVGNGSLIYPSPNGYDISLNRTDPHGYWSVGDRINVSNPNGRLAAGNWTIAIVYTPYGESMAQVIQTIEPLN
jgi:hypothetical protein